MVITPTPRLLAEITGILFVASDGNTTANSILIQGEQEGLKTLSSIMLSRHRLHIEADSFLRTCSNETKVNIHHYMRDLHTSSLNCAGVLINCLACGTSPDDKLGQHIAETVEQLNLDTLDNNNNIVYKKAPELIVRVIVEKLNISDEVLLC